MKFRLSLSLPREKWLVLEEEACQGQGSATSGTRLLLPDRVPPTAGSAYAAGDAGCTPAASTSVTICPCLSHDRPAIRHVNPAGPNDHDTHGVNFQWGRSVPRRGSSRGVRLFIHKFEITWLALPTRQLERFQRASSVRWFFENWNELDPFESNDHTIISKDKKRNKLSPQGMEKIVDGKYSHRSEFFS